MCLQVELMIGWREQGCLNLKTVSSLSLWFTAGLVSLLGLVALV